MRRFLLVIAFVLVVGGLVGLLLDQIHVLGGALTYAHPSWLDQAWWVAPQFGIAFALGATFGLLLQHRLDPERLEQPNARRILAAGVWFVAAYVATGLLWERPWLLTAILLAALLVRTLRDAPDRLTVALMLVLAVFGTGWELGLSSAPGTFSYADPQLGSVPIWLPLLYVHSAQLVRGLLVLGARLVWPSTPDAN
jgi:hypothetical protein